MMIVLAADLGWPTLAVSGFALFVAGFLSAAAIFGSRQHLAMNLVFVVALLGLVAFTLVTGAMADE